MKKVALMFLFVFAGCGVTERVEIIREMVGCTSDTMCADRDEMTTEYCEVDSGICVRERVVTAGCETFADCDDGDASSVDTCVESVCNHTRDVTAPFDPASPERQDVQALCEQPVSCDLGTGPSVSMSFTTCRGTRDAWSQRGYSLWLQLSQPPDGLSRLHILPQLRAGNPDDLFRVSVYVEDIREAPVFVRDMTGHEIEAEGVTINVAPPAEGEWYAVNVLIYFDFAEPEAYRSRALQWALPIGSVTNADSGANYTPCMQVGRYTAVPQHGLLHLTENVLTREALCTGTVRGPDAWTAGAVYPQGLFRTVSDSRLSYIVPFSSTNRLIQFSSLREFTDWFDSNGDPTAAPTWHPATVCAMAGVYEDAALARALADYEIELVGTRPGTPVMWNDPSTGTHYGFADRQWVIRDIGPAMGYPMSGLSCTNYESHDLGSGCWLDLTGFTHRYTVVTTDITAINQVAMDTASGWLAWYNQDPPTGP